MLKAIRQTFYFIFVDQKVNFQNKNTILLEISFKKIHISTIYGIFYYYFTKINVSLEISKYIRYFFRP